MPRPCFAAALRLAAVAFLVSAAQEAPRLRLEPGDRVCIIGNTLADRMQHDGWLETLLHSRFPRHELVIRNLGFSGDEISLRLRSSGFGSPDQHLAFNKADVIFAFFGYNESFGGEAGLEKFRRDLDGFVASTLEKKYNGKGPPRLVLFSPVAHEDLRDPNLPDGAAANLRLAPYVRAMAETARARGIPFVDLFAPSRKLYAAAPRPLTINGVHLTEEGDRLLALSIDGALFPDPGPVRETDFLEGIRRRVLDKNFHWFHRYRATDGYSTFGGRADLRFVNGQTNREVMQRELEILDVLTANRDRATWAAAQGRPTAPDDSSAPPFVPVTTNKPGQGPGGKHLFLEAELAISRMQVARGMKVNLYASEEQFPELANPVQMAFDAKGRLWVAAWPTYPHWKPREPMNDRLLILEDADGDGRADRCKVFAGDLHNPTGFEFYNGGVLVAMAPDLLFLKDTDGDDRADVRERVLHGLDSADTHHTSNSFVFDAGGALYFQEGTFHHTQVETPWAAPERSANAAVFRYEPRSHKFEVYVGFGFANPHGHVFDRWGQDLVTDGTGAQTYVGLSFSGRVHFPRKHPKPPQAYQQRTRPCAGTEILSSRHFPEGNQGHFLVTNVIGFQGILQYRISDKGSGFSGAEAEPIVSSTDPNFRPSDVEVGPDGAIYFTDWHNPIIGHMQHNLRDPSRDRAHGRVYRVTHLDRPLLKPPAIAGQPIEKLLDLLKEPEDRVRSRAKIELSGRPTGEVVAALGKWVTALDAGDREHEHHLLEALWVHQWHNVVNDGLLRRLLRSPDFRARAAATRVLRYWRDRVPKALDLLRVQAGDEHPRVRLEAVVACSFFEDAQAAAVALECLRRPRDEFLDYGLKETMATLKPWWEPAFREGKLDLAADNPAAAEFLVGSVSTADLSKLPKNAAVRLALLTRHGVPRETRKDALNGVARASGSDELTVLLEVIGRVEPGPHAAHVTTELAEILVERPVAELRSAGERIRALARKGPTPEARQAGWAAWVVLEGSADPAWAAAEKSAGSLVEFLGAIGWIPDGRLRGSLYAKVRPLLAAAPPAGPEPAEVPGARAIRVDYFEPAPKNVALETLAALKPRAGGAADEISLKVPQIRRRDNFALRFAAMLAAPREGPYTFFAASDDGSRIYVDGKLVVDNDGLHGMAEKSGTVRLAAGDHAIVVTYFDNGGGDGLEVAWQGPGFTKRPLAGGAPAAAAPSIPDAAVRALASIPGHEREKFDDLAALVKAGRRPGGVFAALRAIDRKHWPAAEARPLVNAVLALASALPPAERTTPDVLEALRFGREIAGLLPKEEGERALAMLKNLDVNIVVIRPVPHQMVYDRRRIVVEAGKPVEILFENVDIMPHNLVITAPGAMAEVGQLAEGMGPSGEERGYVPSSPRVLWATRLLLPGQFEKLRFIAPKAPGRYPYVCTFPGHWLVMNGVMEVVEKGAVPALAEGPAPAAVLSRPFVRMWTLADLEEDVKALSKRSFAGGKEAFGAAGCAKCHLFAGEGSKLGPDLTKIAEKYKGRDLLRQIIDPSTEINEQFRPQVIQTTDGDVVAGIVAKEDERGLHVIANLLQPEEVTIVPKARVAARKPAALSSMPTGLLVTLGKDEILDLVAYVESGGDPNHRIFK